MSKIKKLLIIYIIIVLIFILILLFILSKTVTQGTINQTEIDQNNNINNSIINNNEIQINDSEFDIEKKVINNKLDYVKDRTTYYTIRNIYMKYLNILGNKEKESLLNIVSPLYIKKYDINKVIEDKYILTNSSQYYTIINLDILEAEISNNELLYIAKGKCKIINKDMELIDINIMIKIQNEDNIFYIYPEEYLIKEGYNSLKNGDLFKDKLDTIEDKQINRYNSISKSDNEMAKEYFDNMKKLILYYPDKLYDMLEEEYKNIKFTNKEEYEKYIERNRKNLLKIKFVKYDVVAANDYVDYFCEDQYGNIYIIREQDNIMQYKCFLDSYTVMSENTEKEYQKLNKLEKAKESIRNFINMVNNKDYRMIYNIMDEVTKEEKLNTIDKVEEFIKENFYDRNKFVIENSDTNNKEYIEHNCIIINAEDEKEFKRINIKTKQGEEVEFFISFDG